MRQYKYQVRGAAAGSEQAMRRLGGDRGDRQWEWRGLEVGGRPWNLDLAAVILIDGQRSWCVIFNVYLFISKRCRRFRYFST